MQTFQNVYTCSVKSTVILTWRPRYRAGSRQCRTDEKCSWHRIICWSLTQNVLHRWSIGVAFCYSAFHIFQFCCFFSFTESLIDTLLVVVFASIHVLTLSLSSPLRCSQLSGKNHVKFRNFVNISGKYQWIPVFCSYFSGKNHVKVGILLNFYTYFSGINVLPSPPKLTPIYAYERETPSA